MNLLLGLGACSGGDKDKDTPTSERDDAVQTDASSSDTPARRNDAGAAKPSRSRADAAASDDAPMVDASSPEPEKDASAEPAKASEDKPERADPKEPKDETSEPSDAGQARQDAGPADAGEAAPEPPLSEDSFALRVVASGLDAPWEIIWGPDSQLWITERVGRVVRIDPATGTQTLALTIADVYRGSTQDGLLGMALHPQLGQSLGNEFVYLAYTYDADAGQPLVRRAKIVRYTYDAATQTLGSPQELINTLPASYDQNSGRLVYGPDDNLYYSIGDQGHNQYDNKCLPIRAQDLPTQPEIDGADWSTYQGKILRLGLNGAIPETNPTLAGVRSHIFSYGHRNALGLAFGPDGKLYASEQGPRTDDELNLIGPGKNYGWPFVAGYRDDNAYVYSNWSASVPEMCETLSFSDYEVPESVPKQQESAWSGEYATPLRTFYTVDNSVGFVDATCAEDPSICWPTVAPASLDVYEPGSDGLQSWGTALLVPSLKKGSVLRVKLAANGEITEGSTKELFKTQNRYRDLAIAPTKRTFYVVTDNQGATSRPEGGSTAELAHRGAVLEFTHGR